MSFPPGGEDLSAFYDHTATHAPVAGGAATVIDGNYYPQFDDPLQRVESQKNVFRCALDAVPAWEQGDILLIGAVTYSVRTIQRNEPTPGEVLLMLKL